MTERRTQIDVRQIPTTQRHAFIFDRFDALATSDEITLIVDHEPRPLRTQFGELRPRQFMWMQRFLGNGIWEATIRRIVDSTNADEISGFLNRCPIVRDLSGEALHRLAEVAVELVVERNAAIVEQGQDWPYLGIVRSGEVSAILTSTLGREQALYDILATEPFNETGVLDGSVTVARFVASTEKARVILLPAASIDRLLADSPMLRQVALLAGQRNRILIERFTALVSLPIVARVAATLLPHAPPLPGLAPVLAPLDGMTQVQLAIAAGTVKEVLNRSLSELESAGAIRRLHGRITHLDRERLTSFAHIM